MAHRSSANLITPLQKYPWNYPPHDDKVPIDKHSSVKLIRRQ